MNVRNRNILKYLTAYVQPNGFDYIYYSPHEDVPNIVDLLFYTGNNTEVTVPHKYRDLIVNSIECMCFMNTDVESVTISDGIESIM